MVIGQTYSGGLHFMQSADLILERQDVILTLDKVTVTYLLTNNSNRDIHETVVFPIPLKNDDNFKQFNVVVNNKPIQYQILQRAISNSGRDITAILKNLGLPFNPIAAMQSIDTSQNRDSITAKLRTQNLIDKKEDTTQWFVKTFYHWQQVFPAKSTTKIEQSYKPTVVSNNVKLKGLSSVFTWPVRLIKRVANVAIHWTLEDKVAAQELQAQLEKYNPQIKQYCPRIEDYQELLIPTKNVNTKRNKEMKELNFGYANLDTWAAPIHRFSLRIEIPKNMQPMLCWHSDFKKQDDFLIFTAENYVPVQNVSVLYIDR